MFSLWIVSVFNINYSCKVGILPFTPKTLSFALGVIYQKVIS
jgi:hypothetical protein